jgi:hypothetical protein
VKDELEKIWSSSLSSSLRTKGIAETQGQGSTGFRVIEPEVSSLSKDKGLSVALCDGVQQSVPQ